jgi:hypothetical protein
MTTSGVLAVVAILGLAGAGTALHLENRDLARRLDDLSLQVATVPEHPLASGPEGRGGASGPVLEGTPATRAEVADLRSALEAVASRVTAQEKRAGAAPGAPGAFDGEAFEQSVRAVLERVQEEPTFKEKVAQAAGKPALENKPTFGALAKYLALDESQETTFRRDLEDVQGELFALLADRRPDGRVLLEEIAAAETLPANDPKKTEVFLDLFKLKIPGTEQTYVEKAVALATSFRKKSDGYLRPEQRERFAAVQVDLFGVKLN